MKESDNGCKGCASCSCKDVNTEDVKLFGDGHYTAPDGTVYEIGKGDFAEPGKVYVNDYGVFLAEGDCDDIAYDPSCKGCCAWNDYRIQGIDKFADEEMTELCGLFPQCTSIYNVIFKCLQSNYDWLKTSEIKGAE